MESSTPCLVVAFGVIPLLTLLAYAVAARAEHQAAGDRLLETTVEGTIVAVQSAATRGPWLTLRTADGALLAVAPVEALDAAGLRAGQRLRVRGQLRDEPTVDGEIVDLRQPPAPHRVFRATALVPIPDDPRAVDSIRPLLLAFVAGVAVLLATGARLGEGLDVGAVCVIAAAGMMVWMRTSMTRSP